jgi:hypothetical protein
MMLCQNCGSDELKKRGFLKNMAQRYRCKKCGSWTSENENGDADDEYTFTDMGNTAEVVATLDEDTVNSPEKLLRAMRVDDSVWEVYKKQIGKSPAWRKDRSVNWKVRNGQVLSGDVEDSGKIKIVPVYTVKLWLRRKTEEIRTNLILEDFRSNVHKFSLRKTKSVVFKKPQNGYMLEVEMPDIHFGKLTWGEESGEDGDLKIQIKTSKKVMEELLSYSNKFPIEKIVFPIGHDFYNVDNQFNTTTHGTPQQEDTRWRKTFRDGWSLAAELINACAQIAPVDVPIIGGNHDEERSFYLGEVLSGLYSNTSRISIENCAKMRKYIVYGTNLIGMTHGYHENIKELKDIMAFEVPELWAKSKFKEWHTGDKHHKEDFVHKTHEEKTGVVIRILRSLTTTDTWHYNKGYIGALRASEAFLWDKDNGLKAQFTAMP